MNRAAHLVSRFLSSLHPRALDPETLTWVVGALEPGELHVWEGLDRADQAESVAVARKLQTTLANTADASDPRWVAAALLHDVGKQASAYGPFGRALATVVVAFVGSENARAWADEPGRLKGRIGRYAGHDDVGADLLGVAGARSEAVAWARAHHRPEQWAETGFPPGVCAALARADGEPGA